MLLAHKYNMYILKKQIFNKILFTARAQNLAKIHTSQHLTPKETESKRQFIIKLLLYCTPKFFFYEY